MRAAEFETLLQRAMGLDCASIGSSAIEHAVRQRLAACGLSDPEQYLERLRSSDRELQELIEAVVVPETWFFRDRDVFTALGRLAWEQWLRTHGAARLRLLSLPCATGEEAYSMAMTLLDAGVPTLGFQIDAVDISRPLLDHARHGEYGKNSFRGGELGFRERHFTEAAQTYRIHDRLRHQVQFQHGNLLAPDFLPGEAVYDLIFFRNLLIYFDRATQTRALRVLQRLLKPDGFLFVGPSEVPVLLNHGFVPAQPMAYSLRKSAPPAAAKVRPRPTKASPAPAPRPASRPSVKPAALPQRPQTPADAGVDEAARLADQGHLAEAARVCEAHLRQHGPCAHVFHLLGLVRDASGNAEEAAIYYRKALYLEPQHPEALVHLALLLEKQGKAADAQRLRKRSRRSDARRSGAVS